METLAQATNVMWHDSSNVMISVN